ncbi:AAA family ATPase [Prevotella melaninogenica]|uniref:AAA family ATPase n=1 Tax=Prevotella melaninogenica TaxID=28132 RepID=UPI001D135F5F|nr:AAA family ATPase [Prevotella melaninogenica]UEB00325.1 AAA family ATPase [Prevotella melaninogenica]
MSFKKIDSNDFITAAREYKVFEGFKCGVKSIDEIFRIDKQTLTTLVAMPASGKSTFTNFYGYRMAKNQHWKTLYIATETPKARQCRLLSVLFNSATKASEFSVLYDYDFSDWNDLLMMIKDAKETYGVDMVVIDNFTMLKKLIKGNDSDTERIGRALSDLKKASIDNDIAVILVTHPTKLNEGQKVTAYSVNGSANFFNISDYMFTLTADRDKFETTIEILKVRDDTKGVMGGTCTLDYDDVHFKYSDNYSTEDSSTESTEDSQHDTPKDINYDIAREVMKEIEEEAKQEDRQPAGNTTAAAQAATDTAANTPSRDNTSKQPAGTTKAAPAVEQTAVPAAKEKAKEEKQETAKQHITPDFIHNTKVSIMERHNVLKTSSLYNAIKTGRKHKEEIEAVRSIDRQANESEYKKAKEKVLSYTPSCLCPNGGSAKAENVFHVNNLIAIDLDAKDNEGVTLEEMRTKINSLPYVMYSSISVGGKGMYALLPISENNKNDFKGVFKALEEDFNKIGLKLDSSCVNVNRERYMSYDDNEYWNKQCEIYDRKINIPTQVNTHPSKVGENVNKPLTAREYNKVKSMVEDIKENRLQLSKNHSDTLLLCNAIANIWGEEGRELIHIIRQQRSGYDEYKTDNNYTHVLDHLDEGEKFGLGLIFDKYNQAKGQTQAH